MSWRAPRLWRFALLAATPVIALFCRLRVTGSVPPQLRSGPLILAGNHLSNFDPFCDAIACRKVGLAPRMMATGGLFRAPVIGPFMRASGHIPVDRGRDTVTQALPDALEALAQGSVIFIYPEGRINRDPGIWPERARTGMARLALATGAPVVPVVTWGSHEVIVYHGFLAMLWSALVAVVRRPVVRVHFGAPVDLSGLSGSIDGRPVVGDAQRATDRVLDALTSELAKLREDEPRLPRFIDDTRPITTARSRRSAHRPAD